MPSQSPELPVTDLDSCWRAARIDNVYEQPFKRAVAKLLAAQSDQPAPLATEEDDLIGEAFAKASESYPRTRYVCQPAQDPRELPRWSVTDVPMAHSIDVCSVTFHRNDRRSDNAMAQLTEAINNWLPAQSHAELERPFDGDSNALQNKCDRREPLSLDEQRELYLWLEDRGSTVADLDESLTAAEDENKRLRAAQRDALRKATELADEAELDRESILKIFDSNRQAVVGRCQYEAACAWRDAALIVKSRLAARVRELQPLCPPTSDILDDMKANHEIG